MTTKPINHVRASARVTHKTCPTWGVTQCMKPLWPDKIDGAPKTTERWRGVTCKKCLKDKP